MISAIQNKKMVGIVSHWMVLLNLFGVDKIFLVAAKETCSKDRFAWDVPNIRSL